MHEVGLARTCFNSSNENVKYNMINVHHVDCKSDSLKGSSTVGPQESLDQLIIRLNALVIFDFSLRSP